MLYFLCVYIGCKLFIMFSIFDIVIYFHYFLLFIYLFIYLFMLWYILNVCNVYIESLNVIFFMRVYRPIIL